MTLQQAMADATEQLMELSFNTPADINCGGCFEWATLVFADGSRVPGAIGADQVEKRLN